MQPLSGTPRSTPVLQALHDVGNVSIMGGLIHAVNVEKYHFMCLARTWFVSSECLNLQ